MRLWEERLQGASSVDQVVEIAQEFVATWSPHEIARLPVSCRQVTVTEPDDIAQYAFDLVRVQCLDRTTGRELQSMAAFFGAASQKLSQLVAIATARDNNHWRHGQSGLGSQ